MDELQDAIQDARYISAVLESRPRPTQNLQVTLDEDILSTRRKDLLKQSSNFNGPLSFPVIINSYLGYFMFKKYVEQVHPLSKHTFQCLENVMLYQAIENPLTKKNEAMVSIYYIGLRSSS